MSWTVADIKADRAAKPKSVSGVWGNGALMTGNEYPEVVVPRPEIYGVYETRDEAIRALVLVYHPELIGCTTEHAKRAAKGLISGSFKTHKIVKLDH